ncbi:hypothetical protein TNCV_1212031, partial [Trichonephila clavipes]
LERFARSNKEALMVEVTIPNCYKQAIRSRDASKWHDAMDKEINETTLAMSLADGQQTTGEGPHNPSNGRNLRRLVLTKFIILPKAKGNRNTSRNRFLSSAGLVLDVKNTCWYFWDNPTHKYPFGEKLTPRP